MIEHSPIIFLILSCRKLGSIVFGPRKPGHEKNVARVKRTFPPGIDDLLRASVGRVDRVGTKFKTIFTYNLFPTDEGNDQVALTESAKSRIHAFITPLGNDAQLLTGDEQNHVAPSF